MARHVAPRSVLWYRVMLPRSSEAEDGTILGPARKTLLPEASILFCTPGVGMQLCACALVAGTHIHLRPQTPLSRTFCKCGAAILPTVLDQATSSENRTICKLRNRCLTGNQWQCISPRPSNTVVVGYHHVCTLLELEE